MKKKELINVFNIAKKIANANYEEFDDTEKALEFFEIVETAFKKQSEVIKKMCGDDFNHYVFYEETVFKYAHDERTLKRELENYFTGKEGAEKRVIELNKKINEAFEKDHAKLKHVLTKEILKQAKVTPIELKFIKEFIKG